MAELQKQEEQWAKYKVRIFAVSVDAPRDSLEMREELGLSFEVLSDTKREVITDWRILNRFERGGIPFPNVYVLNQQRKIVFHSRDRLASRVNSEPLLEFIEAYQQAPELRTKNNRFAKTWPSLMDLLLYFPRRFRRRTK